MADTITPNLGLTGPEVGASTDTWGTKLDANLAIIDNLFPSGHLAIASGGTGAGDAAAARASLGVGSLGTQSASAIAVTGGIAGSVAIVGGTLDGAPIGGTTPASGRFTQVAITVGGVTFPDATIQSTAGTAYTAVIQNVSSNTVLSAGQIELLVKADATGGPITITLYSAVGNATRRIDIPKLDPTLNVVTINTTGGQTIDGASSIGIYTQFDSLTFISDNANWIII